MNAKEREEYLSLLNDSRDLLSKKYGQLTEANAIVERLKNDINIILGRTSVYEELLELPDEERSAIFKVED